MKARAVMISLALLLAAPAQAQRSGSHFGGARGGSGGHGTTHGGGAPRGAAAPRMGSLARPAFTGQHTSSAPSRLTGNVVFVPPPSAPPAIGASFVGSPAGTKIVPAQAQRPLTTSSARRFPMWRGAVNTRPSTFPNSTFFGRDVVIFFDGFFSPFCDFGVVNPFLFQRRFFFLFAHRRFLGGFFIPFVFDPFLLRNAEMVQQTAGEPAEPPASGTYEPEAGIVEPVPEAGMSRRVSAPLTLLVFTDGSMYGVVDYWLDGRGLHYLTSYGGENSVPLERVDLYATAKANWERGVPFTLRPGPNP